MFPNWKYKFLHRKPYVRSYKLALNLNSYKIASYKGFALFKPLKLWVKSQKSIPRFARSIAPFHIFLPNSSYQPDELNQTGDHKPNKREPDGRRKREVWIETNIKRIMRKKTKGI